MSNSTFMKGDKGIYCNEIIVPQDVNGNIDKKLKVHTLNRNYLQ